MTLYDPVLRALTEEWFNTFEAAVGGFKKHIEDPSAWLAYFLEHVARSWLPPELDKLRSVHSRPQLVTPFYTFAITDVDKYQSFIKSELSTMDVSTDLPNIKVEVVRRLERPEKPFLDVRHDEYVITYEDGSKSVPSKYDSVVRRGMNAAVIAAYYYKRGQYHVYLRSCIRTALLHADPPETPNTWECAAGVVDEGEDPQQAAARECLEELGFDYPVESFFKLGEPAYPSVGMCGERLYFYAIRVDPEDQKEPTLDGSALEHQGKVIAVPLKTALEMVENGQIIDLKTEVALNRLNIR